MAAVLGGLDVLALAGGIGEHNADMRAGLAERLAWLGVGSTVPLPVIEAREDLQVAAQTEELLRRPARGPAARARIRSGSVRTITGRMADAPGGCGSAALPPPWPD